jgi:hypothetical protein
LGTYIRKPGKRKKGVVDMKYLEFALEEIRNIMNPDVLIKQT